MSNDYTAEENATFEAELLAQVIERPDSTRIARIIAASFVRVLAAAAWRQMATELDGADVRRLYPALRQMMPEEADAGFGVFFEQLERLAPGLLDSIQTDAFEQADALEAGDWPELVGE